MVVIKLYDNLDLEKLQFLGAGKQGKVYKINTQKCIKIFKRRQICEDEIETLVMAQKDPHFPRLYSFGKNHIIREFIDGIELDKYLASQLLTEDTSKKIIELYYAMKSVGYRRLDAAPFHIFLTSSNNIRLIDTARAMKKESIYPSLIIKCLEDSKCKEQFLDFVKCTDAKLYNSWFTKNK